MAARRLVGWCNRLKAAIAVAAALAIVDAYAGSAAATGTTSHHAPPAKSAVKGTRAACEAVAAAYLKGMNADVEAGESDPFTPAELAKTRETIVTNCLKLGINSSYVRSLESQ